MQSYLKTLNLLNIKLIQDVFGFDHGLIGVQVRVFHRGQNVGMPKQFLNFINRQNILDEFAGASMSQTMQREVLWANFIHCFP